MRCSLLLCSAALVGANLAVVQPAASAKTAVEIGRIAKNITVLINATGSGGSGSGTILQKQGNTYTILTAAHVVSAGKSLKLTTVDGQVYQPIPNSVRRAGNGTDLAILKFKASQNYAVAVIGDCNVLEAGMDVYVAGFPAATQTINSATWNFSDGKIKANSTRANEKGYSLIYSNDTLPGMSGGPVLNNRGELVAIHGQGDRSEVGQKTGFNLGVSINRFGTLAMEMGVQLAEKIATIDQNKTPKADNYFLAANEQNEQRRYPEALQSYNQAIKLNPNYADAYSNRGALKYVSLNDFSGALADYNQAIKINPKLTIAYVRRAHLRKSRLAEFPGALADYNQAIMLDPRRASSYFLRGRLKEEKLIDFPGALADYNQAIVLDTDRALFYFYRARLKAKNLSDIQGSLADYNKSIMLDPKYASAYVARAQLKKDKLQDLAGTLEDLRYAANLYRLQGQEASWRSVDNQLRKLGAN
jgi:tetratricopeptide (TPR) repeat protein